MRSSGSGEACPLTYATSQGDGSLSFTILAKREIVLLPEQVRGRQLVQGADQLLDSALWGRSNGRVELRGVSFKRDHLWASLLCGACSRKGLLQAIPF